MRKWIERGGVRRTEPEHELREALTLPGCAVCRLALRTAARQLDILSYEAINDLDLRARIRAARGFCRRHAWQLLDETRDPLGTAIVCRDVLNTLLARLPAPRWEAWLAAAGRALTLGRRAASPDRALVRRLAPRAGCHVCAAEEETTTLYLRLLAGQPAPGRRAGVAGMGSATDRAADGLCRPHRRRALGLAGREPAAGLPAGADAEPSSPGLAAEGRPTMALAWQLAAAFGRLEARRAQLPPELVVDVQRRRLEESRGPGQVVAAEPECPACRLAASVVRATGQQGDWRDGAELARLCGRHAWRLLALDAPGLAAGLRELGAAEPRAAPARGGEPPRPSTGCPLCQEDAAAERTAVAAALGRLEAAGWPGPLCLPHLLLACELPAGGGVRRALVAGQAAAWRDLSAALAEFIRKHDYRFQAEPRGAEQSSPWRDVALLVGPR